MISHTYKMACRMHHSKACRNEADKNKEIEMKVKETFFGNIETEEDRAIDCHTGNYDCEKCSFRNYNRNCRNQPIYNTKVDQKELSELGFYAD